MKKKNSSIKRAEAGKGVGKPTPLKAKVKPGYLAHCTKPEHVLGLDYGQDKGTVG